MSKALAKVLTDTSISKATMRDTVVMRLVEAEKALMFAVTAPQAKLLSDVAAAQEVFATRQRLGDDVIAHAHSLRIDALSRLGELLADMQKAVGGRPSKTGAAKVPVSTLAVLGIDKKTSAIAQRLAALPDSTRNAIKARETTLSEAMREHKAVEMRKRVDLPDAKYRVVYADPPWSYNDKADAGSVQTGGAAHQYPTMSMKELCELDVRSICEPDAVLFLWVTSPLLFECQPVITAWGFDYRASIVWNKDAHNMGHYVSVQHEFLLICVRGSCTPDISQRLPSVVTEKRGAHSVKPACFRSMIDTMYPHGKRIEMFARQQSDGWATYGNDVLPETA